MAKPQGTSPPESLWVCIYNWNNKLYKCQSRRTSFTDNALFCNTQTFLRSTFSSGLNYFHSKCRSPTSKRGAWLRSRLEPRRKAHPLYLSITRHSKRLMVKFKAFPRSTNHAAATSRAGTRLLSGAAFLLQLTRAARIDLERLSPTLAGMTPAFMWPLNSSPDARSARSHLVLLILLSMRTA